MINPVTCKLFETTIEWISNLQSEHVQSKHWRSGYVEKFKPQNFKNIAGYTKVYGGYTEVYGGIRVVYGRYTECIRGIRVVYGMYTEYMGGYTEGIRQVYGMYTGGIRKYTEVYGISSL